MMTLVYFINLKHTYKTFSTLLHDLLTLSTVSRQLAYLPLQVSILICGIAPEYPVNTKGHCIGLLMSFLPLKVPNPWTTEINILGQQCRCHETGLIPV